ncbi:pre-mRNA-processing factor 39-1 isoform X2 [Nymphaea colorata]|uniref:pre-mRNA-processing factor 39-1 isoform X2 n=1 Tax=Nymphaea colorata TaxID=210225 RepID=UPI00214E9983|nr:pre-mRNA-processing factor 39-1 isoform X2 [Nymphaea colorata]
MPTFVASPDAVDEDRHWALVHENPTHFGLWTSLIAFVEKMYAADLGKICQVYDSFLCEFPLCYGYWRRYADHMLSLGTADKVVEVYEEATKSLAYSVDHWVNYCTFAVMWFDDPADVRRLFERALSFVGKDYLNYLLWDKYAEFEFAQEQWGRLARIYLRSLKFPNKKLDKYFRSFKQLSANWRDELETEKDGSVVNDLKDAVNDTVSKAECSQDDDLMHLKSDMTKSLALEKYLSAGGQLYHEANCLDGEIKQFEAGIRRPYFHVKPLDSSQLKNWHMYLDFIETKTDFDWVIKLYERCLIPCASYPEFWIRYVQSIEAKGGREIASAALLRATQIFLKRVPAIHLFAARFMEQVRDVSGAHTELSNYSLDSPADYIENVIRRANMERRLGNVEAACVVYERELEFVKEGERLQALPFLYMQYSQFKLMAAGSIKEARDILIKGIQRLPHCKLLYEALINFETVHGGSKQIAPLESIIQKAVAPEPDVSDALSTSDRKQISYMFLEFIDWCGDIHQLKRAWDIHIKLFPHTLRPDSSQGNTTAECKFLVTNLVGRLLPASILAGGCGNKLHDHPQHFTQKPTSSERKMSNMVEVCQSEDRNGGVNVERPKEVSCHAAETHSFPDMTVHIPEYVESSNLGSKDQESLDRRDKAVEQSKIEIMNQKPISEAESGGVQPRFELHGQKSEIDLQPPPLETLSISPSQHGNRPSCPTSFHEGKSPSWISQSNGSLAQGIDNNRFTVRYDKVQSQADLLETKQDQKVQDTSHSVENPRVQSTGTLSSDPTKLQAHQVLPVNTAPGHQDPAAGYWRQMQYMGQPYATPNFGYQVYAQQLQQWQSGPPMASYPPVDARSQVQPRQGSPYPSGYQYQAPPPAYYGPTQAWPVQNLQQTVVPVPQGQQNTDAVPSLYHQGLASHYAAAGTEYYGDAQTQQGFAWHLQQQYQQPQLQQQHQEWNSSHYQQGVSERSNVDMSHGLEYEEQAGTPQVEEANCPKGGPVAPVHSILQVQTPSSQ